MFEIFKIPMIAVIAVYSVILLGMFCRRIEWITKESSETVLKLVINLLTPCLIISKVVSNEAFNDPRNLYLPPLTGYGIVILGIGISILWCRCLPVKWTGIKTAREIGTFAACAGMLNYGYVPIPLLADLYPGDNRLLTVLFIQNMGVELGLWTLCVCCFQGTFSWKTVRNMLNIPTITILGSIAVNLLGWDRYIPSLVMKPIDMLAVTAIPISLLFVGATIADYMKPQQFREEGKTFLKIGIGSCLIRLVILPALIILLARYLPCSKELKIVLVVHAAMASAIFPIVMSRIYDGCVRTALSTVLSNTFPAIITTPVWIAIGLKFLAL